MILYLDTSALVKLFVKEAFSEVVKTAASLARIHSLRGYDAVHLASAQGVHEASADLVFACFDKHLNEAAVAQTMKVL